ncbi:tetratricopeptide repeat protein [Azospira restricta]|uniref:DUF560 domain-containing protein n=1 Tax=Azospira restricta TaxID=404405 RepID=A0A974Y3G7_9RHOO|nr:tetratricopeptide repeat protein [Azospira restricta]QRJ63855.1 DUF560 domain-containing protein [Azospira restricta]
MQTNKTRTLCAALLAAFALHAPMAFADALTDRAGALLDAGKGVEAYQLLEPQESTRAGEPLFDFLLGRAALEAGQNTRAVFALERVLAVEPNNVRARAEIARAYLALGETQTAEQEFATVKRQGVPADVSMTVDRYIAAMRRAEEPAALTGYVEATVGYDSNVNVGPNRSTIAIPGFGNLPFELDSDTKANADGYGSLGGGVNLRAPLGGGYTLLAGLAGATRNNFGKQQFDTQNADASLGVTRSADRDVYTLMAQGGTFYLDHGRFRDHVSLTGQWQRNLDARNQVGLFAQYAELDYPDQEARDARRWVAGASFAHLYRDGLVAFASAYGVSERPQRHDRADWLGFDGGGLRAGARMNFDAQTVLFGAVSWEYRGYREDDPLFLKKRRDNQFGVSVGATRYLTREWSVTPQLSLTYNDSNTKLTDYHRETLSVTVRREF